MRILLGPRVRGDDNSAEYIKNYHEKGQMPLYAINGKQPQIGIGTWIAPSAEIIGDVVIGDHCYVGFGAIVRGDFGRVVVGNRSLVEEAVVIHCADKVTIGECVIIGHKAMLHDTTIGDHSLIGMQSMLCEYSKIEEWAIVAEQSLVRKHQMVPAHKIYGGSPAKEVGNVTQKHVERLDLGIKVYSDLIKQYLESFKRIHDI